MVDVLKGALRSRTQWFGVLLVALGWLESQKEFLTALIGPDHTGTVLAVVGGLVMILRAVTTKPLAER